MRLWQLASGAFFLYVAFLVVWRGVRRPPARKALAGAAGGLLLVLVSRAVDVPVFNEWIWPPLLLLIAYWSSGLLFEAPSPSQEAALRWLDDRLAIRDVARRTPRALAEVIEAAYAGVYLLVPLALVARLAFSPSPDPDHFWSVVLITDFVCFGVLPWVQTRPPRFLEPDEPWDSPSSIRHLNLRLLGATSIQVNTFPSGHAAEALVAALLVLAAPVGVVFLMFLAALAVSAGAVLGRYHFLVDALAGWIVAVGVFLILS
jgi:membrane-associated phospholipid phosphatase